MTELVDVQPLRCVLIDEGAHWVDDEPATRGDAVFKNLTLSWKNLSVYRKKKHQTSIWWGAKYEEVEVLNGVSGMAQSGNLVALMGSSGAGKTTLLAAISSRDKSAMTGQVLMNGRPAAAELMPMISGFVPQRDLAIEHLTVAEHMEFMARMMMDKRSSKTVRTRRIKQLLGKLGINDCTNTQLKALSGGERKRVSLAVQLINDPPILFCDEPTTGLDSWSASSVCTQLRKLASTGKLVICSIHQPASGVFELFHQVIFLTSGRVAFSGTLAQAEEFFASLNYNCPMGFNPAEYYVSVLGIQIGKETESRERIGKICDAYSSSDIAADLQKKIGDIHEVNDIANEKEQNFERSLVKINCFIQFYWLIWRNFKTMKNNRSTIRAKLFLLLLVGLMLSIPYSGTLDVLDQRDIQNIQGLLYLTNTHVIFMSCYAVFYSMPSEIPVLLREIANGLYSPLPYYLAKAIVWIPITTVESLLYSTLVFFVAGLHGGVMGWLGFCFMCVLGANYANSYGLFLSAVFNSMETSALVSVPFDLVSVMFSGIFINLASVSPLVSWIRYISAFYYGNENISIVIWNSIESISCMNVPGMPCIRTGKDVLKRFGFVESHFWRNCACLVVMYFVLHFIAYIMVRKRSKGTPVY